MKEPSTRPPPRSDPAPAGPVLAATIASAAMIGQQVAGKAARDALFLSSFDITMLPRMAVVAAALSIAAVLGLARVMTAYSPAKVVPRLFLASSLLMAGEWALSLEAPRAAAIAVYVHAAIFGATTISSFWSLVNERFDPRSARRAFSRIGGGGTLGGVIGGVVAFRAATLIPVAAMLLLTAAANLVCVWGTSRLAGSAAAHPVDAPREKASSGLATLGRVPYLRDLALLVGLAALSSSLVDYVFSARAAAALGKGAELLSFFALFYMGVGIVSFGLQAIASRASLDRLGLAGTAALAPGALVAAGALGLVLPSLPSLTAARGSEGSLRNSLFRAAYELFYTPVAASDKRATKLIIDVGFDRAGSALGSGVTLLVLALDPAGALPLLLGLAMTASLAALLLTPRLHSGYVAALGASLRSGSVKIDPVSVLDATTRRTLSETMQVLDREAILAQIRALRAAQAAAPSEPEPARGEALVGARADRVADDVRALRSGDAERIRRVLAARPVEPWLVGHVVPLLAQGALQAPAMHALEAAAPRATGQIVDSLLDPDLPLVVKRKLPRALRGSATQRAADGLLLGLDDARFEVRCECGRSLLVMAEKNRAIVLPRETVLAAAQREIDAGRKVGARPPDEEDDDEPLLGKLVRDRLDRSLEHVFTLLSLVLEREPLLLAYRALNEDDERLRGTALEYLENVLPATIWRGLWPSLGETQGARSVRSREEVLGELLRSMDSAPVDRAGLVARAAGPKP